MTDWCDLTLDQLGRIVTGKTPPTVDSENYGGPIPFVTPSDMDRRRIISDTARYLTVTGLRAVESAKIPPRSVMVSCIGSDMGKAAISEVECVTNQQINSIIVDDEFDPMFVYYNLSVRKEEIRSAASGSAQPIMNKSTFGRLRISVPYKARQTAIASVLSALDDKIELNRRMNETLEAMARAIFKDWLVDFGPIRAKMEGRAPNLASDIWSLFPDRLGVDGKPEGWKHHPIYRIADVIYGAPFASAHFNTAGIGEPLIRIRDLLDESPGVWTAETHSKGYKVCKGDIVVGMDGEFRAYLWGGAEAWLNQRVCVFAPKHGFSAAFVRNSIIAPLAHIEETETATTVIHLGKGDIDHFTAIVPCDKLTEAFNGIAQPLYDRIVANKVESRTLAATRDLLLPKLMSGEMRVRDAEKAVEAAQ